MPVLERHPARTALAALCALLAAIVALELAFPPVAEMPGEDSGTAAAALPDPDQLPAYVPPEFDLFAEVLERPLFYEDRRLPEEPADDPAPAAPREPLRLTLEGIALTNASRVALLRNEADDQLVQMAEGMTHNGWTLERVEPGRAVFSRDGQKTELMLETRPGSARRPRR